MGKIIIILFIVGLVYFLFIRKIEDNSNSKIKTKKDKPSETDTMVECVKCHIFLSPDDTILKNGQYFCSKECANLV